MLGGGAGEAESQFGPDDSGMTIVPYLYRKGFEYFKMGEASAIAYILFFFLFLLTYFNVKFLIKKGQT
jgi:multiple sugar transport system permease protein